MKTISVQVEKKVNEEIQIAVPAFRKSDNEHMALVEEDGKLIYYSVYHSAHNDFILINKQQYSASSGYDLSRGIESNEQEFWAQYKEVLGKLKPPSRKRPLPSGTENPGDNGQPSVHPIPN